MHQAMEHDRIELILSANCSARTGIRLNTQLVDSVHYSQIFDGATLPGRW
jgi:hypothetical protein